VYPMSLKGYEIMQAFEPPHFDAVTSLAVLNDGSLISGSRDKHLRCWNTQSLTSLSSNLAHNDMINTLETDHERKMLYSGCRDGTVKVWKMNPLTRQLRCAAQLSNPNALGGVSSTITGNSTSGGGQSINSICKIDKQFGATMFATGGSDK
jgi:WD40 repeat protein